MRCTRNTCCASFCPNSATSGRTMPSSFAHHGQHPVEVPGPGRALEERRDGAAVTGAVSARRPGTSPRRSARTRRRRRAASGGEVGVERPRVALEVLARTELQRVHEDRHHRRHRRAGSARSTSARWPSCSAPIVGTSATRAPSGSRSSAIGCAHASTWTPRCAVIRPPGRPGRSCAAVVVALAERVLDRGAHERREHAPRALDADAGQERGGLPDDGARERGGRGDRLARTPRGRPPPRAPARRPSPRPAPARSAARGSARSPRNSLAQPAEVDARAGEGHRRMHRERNRPGRESPGRAPRCRTRAPCAAPAGPACQAPVAGETGDQRRQFGIGHGEHAPVRCARPWPGSRASGTPGSMASARSRLACDTAEMPTIACPAPASAAPSTGPTWPAPMMPTPSLPDARPASRRAPRRASGAMSRAADTMRSVAVSRNKRAPPGGPAPRARQ